MIAEQIGTSPNLPRRRGKARASLDLIAAAYAFLETAHPTSIRGVCYHLFTRGVIRSMAKAETSRVSRLLRDAREAGTIPWEWIVDETRSLERAPQWRDAREYIATVRRSYRLDFWEQQPCRVEVWSEKGTIRGVLSPVLEEYGVGFRVMHGFGSATTLYDVARSPDDYPRVALYVGDWDPSGLFMSEHDLPSRLARYAGSHITVERIALLADDLATLPSFAASEKRSDPRYRWFVERHGERCWELDAMHPNDLRARVEHRIVGLIEPAAWARCERAQAAEQGSLESVLDRWTALVPGAA